MTKLVVKRATKSLWGTSLCRTAPTGRVRVFLILSVTLCFCWSSLLLLWEHQLPHDSAQLGVGGEQLEKEKGREGSGLRIQGKNGRNLSRSLLDRSTQSTSIISTADLLWEFSFFTAYSLLTEVFYVISCDHCQIDCFYLPSLGIETFQVTGRNIIFFCNHSSQISHHWYWLYLWDTLCTSQISALSSPSESTEVPL